MSSPLSIWLQAPSDLQRHVQALEPAYLERLRERLQQVKKLGVDAVVVPISWRTLAPFHPQDIDDAKRWYGYQQVCRNIVDQGLKLVIDISFAARGMDQPRLADYLPDWLWGQALSHTTDAPDSLKYQDQYGCDSNIAPSLWSLSTWRPYFTQLIEACSTHLAEFAPHIQLFQLGLGPEGECRYPLLGLYRDQRVHLPSFSSAAQMSLASAMEQTYGSRSQWLAEWQYAGSEDDLTTLMCWISDQVLPAPQSHPAAFRDFTSWYQNDLVTYCRGVLDISHQALSSGWEHVHLGLRMPATLPGSTQSINAEQAMCIAGWSPQPKIDTMQRLIDGAWRDRLQLSLTGLDESANSLCPMLENWLALCADAELPVMLENRQRDALHAHSQWDRLLQQVLNDQHLSGWILRDLDALFDEQEVGIARLRQMGRLKHGQGQIQQLRRKGFRVMGPLHLKVANQKQLLDEENWQAFEDEIRVLRRSGISAVSTDLWWGLIEGRQPGEFDWSYYDRVVDVLGRHGMHWVPILSFHQAGGNVNDDFNQTIPLWLWGKLLENNPDVGSVRDLQYVSETGDGSMEYVSLWADEFVMPYYENFMQAFAEHYREQAHLIDEINVSLGPAGELRYPSYNAHDWGNYPNRGTLQCYSPLAAKDWERYLLRKFGSLSGINYALGTRFKSQDQIGLPDADSLFEQKDYLYSSWSREFLTWYHQSLVDHGRRILGCALAVFSDTAYQSIDIGLKVPGIHWAISDPQTPRAAEITAGLVKPHPGMNMTNQREYLQLFDALVPAPARKRVVLHFTCLEMVNKDYEGFSRAQDLVDWVADAADELGIRLMGENALAGELYNPKGWQQIHRALSREPGFGGITFLRMQNFFDGEALPLQELQRLVNRLQ